MSVRVLIRPKSGEGAQEVLVPGQAPFVLGRGPTSAAPLDGPGISREHLAVSLDGASILVTDLSVNGAWINGKRLPSQEKYRIKPDETVELPGYELKFEAVNSSSLAGSLPDDHSQSVAAGARHGAPPSTRGGVSEFIASFTFMERVLITAAVLSFALAVVYFMSS